MGLNIPQRAAGAGIEPFRLFKAPTERPRPPPRAAQREAAVERARRDGGLTWRSGGSPPGSRGRPRWPARTAPDTCRSRLSQSRPLEETGEGPPPSKNLPFSARATMQTPLLQGTFVAVEPPPALEPPPHLSTRRNQLLTPATRLRSPIWGGKKDLSTGTSFQKRSGTNCATNCLPCREARRRPGKRAQKTHPARCSQSPQSPAEPLRG